jgi:dTDP-4-dehydrorhamnose 3,5-epimerase
MKINPKYSKKASIQNYFGKNQIEGVKIIPLKRFVDCGGSFSEIMRFDKDTPIEFKGFDLKQANYSEILPGAIKAGHYHLNQEDIWFVPPSSRVLVGLKDLRDGSKTYEVVQRLIMGDGHASLLFIPRGVLHGVANLWQKPASLIYFVNQNFDPKKPDENRLPPEEFGKNFWEIAKG